MKQGYSLEGLNALIQKAEAAITPRRQVHKELQNKGNSKPMNLQNLNRFLQALKSLGISTQMIEAAVSENDWNGATDSLAGVLNGFLWASEAKPNLQRRLEQQSQFSGDPYKYTVDKMLRGAFE